MIEAAGEVVRVTLYEDRAEVTRRARAAVAAGTSWLEVGGLGVAVDDASLAASVAGDGARVLAARVHRQERQVSAAGSEALAAMEAEERAARSRRVRAERALERAAAADRRATALLASWTAGVRRVPRGGEDEAARWGLVHERLTGALAAALDEAAARRGEVELAKLDEARASLRLGQGRALHPRFEASARVQIAAERAGEVVVELVYRTPCAAWRPEHMARLDAAGKELTLATTATVWQRTGEDWRGVPCRFSTARPARDASPSLLGDDVVRLQKRLEKTIAVEARDQVIAATGVASGVESPRVQKVDEMPGVEDGGEPLWYEVARPVTIPSDGQPYRVEIAEVRMPCVVDVVSYPEIAGAAHVRATATLAGKRPLLAGPVRVARGASIVGRARVGFVAQGEPFELGFGVDDGLRVRRRVEDRREVTAVVGTQKLTRTVRIFVSNLGDRERKLAVIERVPVSELEEVTVKVVAAEGAKLDAKDGFARFEIELPAGGTRELELSYRVEAAGKVQLGL